MPFDNDVDDLQTPRFGQFVRAGAHKPLMAMIEVTNRCNMQCPVCFSDADSSCQDIPFAEIRSRMERLLEVTGAPIPIQIGGGEPTVRKDLPDIVALARSLGYRNIELITNGIRIARQPRLLLDLKNKGLTAVYLQFDGLKKETYLKIRGQDMTTVRHHAVQATRQARLCCTLSIVVTRGVNDEEIGEVVQYGVDNIDTVRAINFQSATRFTGRFDLDARYGGYSLPALLGLIELQSGIPADSFRSEHLGHPLCNAMSYVFVVNGKLEPLFKYISREDLLAFLGDDGREKVLGLFGGKTQFFTRYLCNPDAWKLIGKALPIFGRNPLTVLSTKHILIFAKSFMEREGLDADRVHQCCYAITDADGIFSFCAFNNLYRFPGRTAPLASKSSRSKL
ncbi:MAG: radical SAM protein [Candidatus Binataceae bacterium]